MSDDRAMALFFELFSGLPRQGPGSPESTRRAWSLIPTFGPSGHVLDIGCGTGAQTLVLAEVTQARIVAVDAHPPFVEELNARAAQLGLGARVRAHVGDMARLEYPSGSFDVVWSEGAAYVMGVDAALDTWKRLLVPGGHLALSELCWLTPEPPPECLAFFAGEYPAMRDVPATLAAVDRADYRRVGHFTLPASAWWDDYYEPLGSNVREFKARHGDDPLALAIAGQTEREIEVFTRYSGSYRYVFFVMQNPGA